MEFCQWSKKSIIDPHDNICDVTYFNQSVSCNPFVILVGGRLRYDMNIAILAIREAGRTEDFWEVCKKRK